MLQFTEKTRKKEENELRFDTSIITKS